jgi:hypothetical protein
MRQSVILCDRCGSAVKTFSIVEVTAGPLRGLLHSPLDLCLTCAESIRGLHQEWSPGVPGRPRRGSAATAVAAPMALI